MIVDMSPEMTWVSRSVYGLVLNSALFKQIFRRGRLLAGVVSLSVRLVGSVPTSMVGLLEVCTINFESLLHTSQKCPIIG